MQLYAWHNFQKIEVLHLMLHTCVIFDRHSKYNKLFYTHTSDALTVPISPKSYDTVRYQTFGVLPV